MGLVRGGVYVPWVRVTLLLLVLLWCASSCVGCCSASYQLDGSLDLLANALQFATVGTNTYLRAKAGTLLVHELLVATLLVVGGEPAQDIAVALSSTQQARCGAERVSG